MLRGDQSVIPFYWIYNLKQHQIMQREFLPMSLPTAKRFTIAEYHKLSELGFFQEDDRIELIHGELITMAAKGTAHVNCCRNLLMELAALIQGQAKLQCQDPISLSSNSEPEPDFVILKNREDNYQFALPQVSDILLVIEVSDSTLKFDQTVKASLYAEAGILEYWIFNLVGNYLETYREPYHNTQGEFAYRIREIFLPNQVITLPKFPEISLNLNQIFPILK